MDNSLPILTIELYTPREIIEARMSFNVATVAEAMLELRKWLANDSGETYAATHFRILNSAGRTMLELPMAMRER